MAHSSPPAHWALSPVANRWALSTGAHDSSKYQNASPAHTTVATKPPALRPIRLPPALHPAVVLLVRQTPQRAHEDPLPWLASSRPHCLRAVAHPPLQEFPESLRATDPPQRAAEAQPLWCGRAILPADRSSPSHRVPSAATPPATSSRS